MIRVCLRLKHHLGSDFGRQRLSRSLDSGRPPHVNLGCQVEMPCPSHPNLMEPLGQGNSEPTHPCLGCVPPFDDRNTACRTWTLDWLCPLGTINDWNPQSQLGHCNYMVTRTKAYFYWL